MKNIFAMLAFALASCAAFAQTTTPTADSWEVRQRNPANNGIIVYYIVPDGTSDQLATYNGTTNKRFAYTARSLNTCFQISSTRDALVSYSVDIGTTSTLLSGQIGTIYLRTYTNSGCSTGTQEIARFVNGNTQTIGLSVTMVQNVTGTLTGVVPAGTWAQLVSENNTGTPTFTYRSSQEVQL